MAGHLQFIQFDLRWNVIRHINKTIINVAYTPRRISI